MQDIEEKVELSPEKLEEFLETARRRFTASAEEEKHLRDAFMDDLRFASPDGDDQWDPLIKQQRLAARRPAMSFPRCHTFVQQVSNEARQKKPTIKFSPRNDEDKDTAEILEGLARFIQYDSQAQVAYETAIQYSAGASFGFYRFTTDYADDESDDLELKVVPVLDPMAVYGVLIPACFNRKVKYAFVVEDMPREEYKLAYPDSEMASLDWVEAGRRAGDWVAEDTVRIAEYWYVEEKKVEGKRRPVSKVKYCKTNGIEILSEDDESTTTDWPGSVIPIIPVLGGQMIQEGKPRLFSVVRPQKAAQQMLNYTKTRIAETLSIAPISPFIAAIGQLEGQEKAWENMNTQLTPVLYYKGTDVNGQPIGPPQRQTFEPPIAALSAFGQAEVDDMKATTGIFDASLGANSNETSGRAIFARQQQSSLSTMHYMDNLARSFKQSGDIIAEIVPLIYDTEREIEILGEDEKQEVVTINAAHEVNGKTKHFKVKDAKMSYVVSMGRAFDSKRSETFDTMQQLAQGNPQSFPLFADIMFRSSDMAGGDELAERFHAMLPPQLQKKDGQDELPPQAKAAMVQAQQQVQALQGELSRLNMERDAKHLEHQGKMEEIQAKSQADLALEDKKLLTQLAVAEATAKNQNVQQRDETYADLMSQLHEQAHELGLQKDQQAHQQQLAQQQAQNQSAQSAQDAGQQQAATAQQPEPAQA